MWASFRKESTRFDRYCLWRPPRGRGAAVFHHLYRERYRIWGMTTAMTKSVKRIYLRLAFPHAIFWRDDETELGPGCQRCGSRSSILLTGCVGSLVNTSFR